jgi:hypothetical protein
MLQQLIKESKSDFRQLGPPKVTCKMLLRIQHCQLGLFYHLKLFMLLFNDSQHNLHWAMQYLITLSRELHVFVDCNTELH